MTIVWVTGARGFIGQHLVRCLADRGQRVSGLGHGAMPPELTTQEGFVHWINGDIDAHNLQQLRNQSGAPSVIYHLAGGSSVGLSLQTPTEDFRRSVVAISALLEWVRVDSPETSVVLSSSAAVYGNTTIAKIPEDGCYTPYSPYGFHKRAAELLCECYAHNFGLKIAIVRLFSVYGPGLRKQLLWDLSCRLQAFPDVLHLHGTGDELRDWLYVSDAVNFLLQAGQEASTKPFILNGATGQATCVRNVATLLCKSWGLSPEIIFSGKQHIGNPFSLVSDTTQSKCLGIEPQVSLADGIDQYVNWFRTVVNVSSS
jgi:UDP-glucose 4-epimerase